MDRLPSTPLRRSNSVTSNSSVSKAFQPVEDGSLPLLNEVLGPEVLADLSDGMATLDVNMQHLQNVHDSLTNFNEQFAGLLHSMKMNAWCVDFPEAPTAASFNRDRGELSQTDTTGPATVENFDATYVTNDDVSFLPEPSPKPATRNKTARLPRVATLVGSGSNARSRASSSQSGSSSSSGARPISASRIPAPTKTFTGSRIPTVARGSSRGGGATRGGSARGSARSARGTSRGNSYSTRGGSRFTSTTGTSSRNLL